MNSHVTMFPILANNTLGASTAGGQAIQNLVITGSLITIIPLVIAFLCLQKYWQSGLAAGAVKE